jgi:hypothetical protein
MKMVDIICQLTEIAIKRQVPKEKIGLGHSPWERVVHLVQFV